MRKLKSTVEPVVRDDFSKGERASRVSLARRGREAVKLKEPITKSGHRERKENESSARAGALNSGSIVVKNSFPISSGATVGTQGQP